MDKQRVKQRMLELEQEQFEASQDAYLEYVQSARLDHSEPIEDDELAQAVFARDLAEGLDEPVHAHAEKIAKLRSMDFGPKQSVEEGAIVTLAGRRFVVSVATDRFICDGEELMGISSRAPLYAAIEGAQAGDTRTFNNREISIQAVI
jgi:hypothetical protein